MTDTRSEIARFFSIPPEALEEVASPTYRYTSRFKLPKVTFTKQRRDAQAEQIDRMIDGDFGHGAIYHVAWGESLIDPNAPKPPRQPLRKRVAEDVRWRLALLLDDLAHDLWWVRDRITDLNLWLALRADDLRWGRNK